jgi:hypothetical protein
METPTKHWLDSLIEAQIVSSRKEEPKAVPHLQALQKKYIESREFTVHILNDMYGV